MPRQGRGRIRKLKAPLRGRFRGFVRDTHPCRPRGTPAEVVLGLALSLIWSPSDLSRIQYLSYSSWRGGHGMLLVSSSQLLPSLSPRLRPLSSPLLYSFSTSLSFPSGLEILPFLYCARMLLECLKTKMQLEMLGHRLLVYFIFVLMV